MTRFEMWPTALLVTLLATACTPARRTSVVEGGASEKDTLVLQYDGAPFAGPSMLFVVLRASDGTKHPLQLAPHDYTAFSDCTKCPAEGRIVEHSPSPGGPPPHKYLPGVIAIYQGATFTKDVISECPAGGKCIRGEPIPPGEYQVELGHRLSCPGAVRVPLVGETRLHCTRP